jgi:glycosyltransferase involved in cell wall biosynthesis
MIGSTGKSVLIITYYWPPSGGAGVQRWLKTVKYLREFGWEPIIYTPENPEVPVLDDSLSNDIIPDIEIIRRPIWEPYKYYKKLVGLKDDDKINSGFLTEKKKPGFTENISVWIRGNLFIPDARKYWIRPSIKFLTGYLKNHLVDAIVSSGPPHSMHLIALEIHKKTGLPWLADFRDPWTGIDFYHQLKLSRWADRKHHQLEKEILLSANAVSVVSHQMEADFKGIHNRNYNIVTNGFDATDFQPISNSQTDIKFSIAHIGSLGPTRNPLILWKVLSELIKEKKEFATNLEIKLVGKVDVSVSNSIQQAGMDEYINKIEYLPHDQVLDVMQKSQVLLLVINQTPNSKGILTGKIFEYLAAQRPIICIGPKDGDAAKVLLETGSGSSFSVEDSEALHSFISKLFESYQQGLPFIGNASIEKYTRKHITGRIAGILDVITGESNVKV